MTGRYGTGLYFIEPQIPEPLKGREMAEEKGEEGEGYGVRKEREREDAPFNFGVRGGDWGHHPSPGGFQRKTTEGERERGAGGGRRGEDFYTGFEGGGERHWRRKWERGEIFCMRGEGG